MQLVGPEVQVQNSPPGEAVTVYRLMGNAPGVADADHVTVALAFPGATVRPVGGEARPMDGSVTFVHWNCFFLPSLVGTHDELCVTKSTVPGFTPRHCVVSIHEIVWCDVCSQSSVVLYSVHVVHLSPSVRHRPLL